MKMPGSSIELVFPPGVAVLPAPWDAPPGAVLSSDSLGLALHFAPARWLLLDTAAALVDAAVQSGALAIDVEGKWTLIELPEPYARRTLSAAVNVEAVLDGRDCAAAILFDCPAVIARRDRGESFVVCVHSSYAFSFKRALAATLGRCRPAA
jgi:sarcosine oxidase gamma subunit